jgi:methyl-accepting chemotaxis protein
MVLPISLLGMPLELLRSFTDSVRVVVEFPATLEQTMRETNALIADARRELGLLGEQIRRMMEQLDKMATVSDRLVEGTRSIAETATGAQQQMVRTTEQLAATNRSLEQLVRFAEPLDRVGKRVADRFLRVTGQRKPPEPEGE